VLVLCLIFVLLFIALAVILVAGTVSIQGNIYSEVTPNVPWKAVAAAAVMTAFYAIWIFVDYRAIAADPNRTDFPFDAIHRFSPKETSDPVDKLWVVKNNNEILYRRQAGDTLAGAKYVDAQTGQQWSRSDSTGIVEAIIIEDKDAKVRFEPKLDAQGNFVPEKPGRDIEPFPGYYEVKGKRKMEQIGQVTSFHWGLYFANWMLNIVHLALWFVLLWLVLRFQWSHALFMGVILWAIATLLIVPMLLDRTQTTVKEKLKPATIIYVPNSLASTVSEGCCPPALALRVGTELRSMPGCA
jgi:hypothetical protein